MPLPVLLTLIRHGHSEGNVAGHASRHGDDKYFTDEYRNRHSANLRLTDRGIKEAKQVGLWLNAEVTTANLWFTHFLTSSHLRAMETAAHLKIVEVRWQVDLRLREREFGDWDMNSYGNRAADPKFFEHGAQRQIEGIYWRPPNGDSVADDATHDVSALLNEWSAMPNGSSLIAVTHAGKMEAFQLVLNREVFHSLAGEKINIGPRITNCHILQYSRWNPDICRFSDRYLFFRSLPFPPEENLSVPWVRLKNPFWSNEEILSYASGFPRVVNDGGKR